uniref:Ycf54 n=1 Tax=Hildenbrandia rivularis TaxID=135206 RepID=A0A1C9CFL0_9FLOR|nr:hypothetical protein Hrvl_094 [Hildenbrandia rivularis]AOM67154.1 hypothetical protein Hrvl_094 [Hildenbrandia rivularis]
MPKYYFAIASEKFLLSEEPTEEILRERVYYYKNNNKPVDFWLIKNPVFLEKPEMHQLQKQLSILRTAAIVSTNALFIKWIKLRLHFVITGKFEQELLS